MKDGLLCSVSDTRVSMGLDLHHMKLCFIRQGQAHVIDDDHANV